MNKKISYISFFSIIMLFFACAESDWYATSTPQPKVPGCMDASACNYDRLSTDDDGSCLYAEENYNCYGECTIQVDCNGVCGGTAGSPDFCGVCGGDNFCNTIKIVDDISGENECIGGTWGIDFGGEDVDECGVCRGDGTSCYDFGNRWVDFKELNDLITYSIDSESIIYDDIINHIGEPEYIEVLKNNNNNYILMWYQYKSKLYPVLKTNHIVNKDNIYVSMEKEEIKPPKSGENDEWSAYKNYLLIVFNNSDFEVFFVPFDNDRDPKFLKEYLFE